MAAKTDSSRASTDRAERAVGNGNGMTDDHIIAGAGQAVGRPGRRRSPVARINSNYLRLAF